MLIYKSHIDLNCERTADTIATGLQYEGNAIASVSFYPFFSTNHMSFRFLIKKEYENT